MAAAATWQRERRCTGVRASVHARTCTCALACQRVGAIAGQLQGHANAPAPHCAHLALLPRQEQRQQLDGLQRGGGGIVDFAGHQLRMHACARVCTRWWERAVGWQGHARTFVCVCPADGRACMQRFPRTFACACMQACACLGPHSAGQLQPPPPCTLTWWLPSAM